MNGKTMGFCMLAAVTAMAGSLYAEEAAAPKAKREEMGLKRFQAMDTDKDGTISLEEYKASQALRHEEIKKRMGDKFDATKLPNAEEAFKKLDADNDGKLSPEELNKPFNRVRQGGEQGGGDRVRKGGQEGGERNRKREGKVEQPVLPPAEM